MEQLSKEELIAKQTAFVNEIAAHYNSNNRCAGEYGTCKYSPKSAGREGLTEGCAIGRKLTPELAEKLDSMAHGSVASSHIFKLLPLELQQLTKNFLRSCQILHDIPEHWNEAGISDEGKKYVAELLEAVERVCTDQHAFDEDAKAYEKLDL